MINESGEKRKRGSASRDLTPDANAADASAPDPSATGAAAPPAPPLHPRPVAPPRPLGTEEDLSHGQRPASDAARADRGVPVADAAHAHAAAAAAAPPSAAAAAAAAAGPPAAKLLVPGHSAWFRYYAVHRLEREALPEWFDGRHAGGEGASSNKTPESYLKLRNLLVDAYREDPLRRLTYTEARARAAAAAASAAAAAAAGGGESGGNAGEAAAGFDAASVLRLHSFLDHWGIVNFQAAPPAAASGEAAGGVFGGRGY